MSNNDSTSNTTGGDAQPKTPIVYFGSTPEEQQVGVRKLVDLFYDEMAATARTKAKNKIRNDARRDCRAQY